MEKIDIVADYPHSYLVGCPRSELVILVYHIKAGARAIYSVLEELSRSLDAKTVDRHHLKKEVLRLMNMVTHFTMAKEAGEVEVVVPGGGESKIPFGAVKV